MVLSHRTCHTMWPDVQEAISKLINERFERDILHSDIVIVWKGKKEVVYTRAFIRVEVLRGIETRTH